MNALTIPAPIIRSHEDGEKRWFFGGGIHNWIVKEEETGGAYFLLEACMEGGKVTPLHTHPVDESMYVLEGEILMHIDGVEHTVGEGGFVLAPRGVPHAFMVVSKLARLLSLQVPGTCQSFYMGASEPITAGHPSSGVVDFDKIMESGQKNGGIEILGPPPFGKP